MASTDGIVELPGARVGIVVDTVESWPEQIRLNGFEYEGFSPTSKILLADRLRWIERDPEGYSPQPYEQLMAVLRRAGHEEDARIVGIAKQRRRRREQTLGKRVRGWFLDAVVGYGYRPWRALGWLGLLIAVGWLTFGALRPRHIVAANTAAHVHLPPFHALIYTLDLLIPLVNLHQRDAWVAQGVAQWLAVCFTLTGWLLTTVAVGALTGLLKRD
jgi:hypothetical protein